MPRSSMAVARVTLVMVGSLALSGAVSAQTPGLSEVLPRFFSPSHPVELAPTGHQAHFGSQPAAAAIMTQLNQGIAGQLATFPVGSSSGGFTYTFDPSLGVFNRTTETFGPLFAERANTAGKGKASFGINYVRSTFDTFEGQNLRDGDIVFFLRHGDVNRDGEVGLEPYFEGDMIRANLFLNLNVDTATAFLNYGLNDRIDVGIAVPTLRIEMNARVRYTIEHLATSADPFVLHAFPGTGDISDVRGGGTTEGVGDILLRGKYRFSTKKGLAVGVDVRLPTGDETQLLGSGATQAKLFAIASGMGARFSPHVNLGYTVSWGGSSATGDLPDEINYTAGFDAAVFRRVTLNADVIGRTLRGTNRIILGEKEYEFHTRISDTIQTAVRPDLQPRRGDLNTLLGAVGLKINPFGHLLISGSVLVSPGKRGLQDFLTPVGSIDYTF